MDKLVASLSRHARLGKKMWVILLSLRDRMMGKTGLFKGKTHEEGGLLPEQHARNGYEKVGKAHLNLGVRLIEKIRFR